MKKFMCVFFCMLMLSGCFGESKFDASSQSSVQNSTKNISKSLPEDKKNEFTTAMMFFTMGSPRGFGDLLQNSNALNPEEKFLSNLKIIDGLTGEEIIQKHKEIIKNNKNITEIEEQAKILIKDNDFEGAIKTYDDLKKIVGGEKIGEDGINKVKILIAEYKEKEKYFDKIKISNFEAKRFDSFLDTKKAGVRFDLKNTGDRNVGEIRVVVYFLDKKGKIIFEEDFYPVSIFNIGGDKNPLRPNYSKEMGDKFYPIDSPLSEWDEGKVIFKIVDIKFVSKPNLID